MEGKGSGGERRRTEPEEVVAAGKGGEWNGRDAGDKVTTRAGRRKDREKNQDCERR